MQQKTQNSPYIATKEDIELLRKCKDFWDKASIGQHPFTMFLKDTLKLFAESQAEQDLNNFPNIMQPKYGFKDFIADWYKTLQKSIKMPEYECQSPEVERPGKLATLDQLHEQLQERLKVHQVTTELTSNQPNKEIITATISIGKEAAEKLIDDAKASKKKINSQSTVFDEDVEGSIFKKIYQVLVELVESFIAFINKDKKEEKQASFKDHLEKQSEKSKEQEGLGM